MARASPSTTVAIRRRDLGAGSPTVADVPDGPRVVRTRQKLDGPGQRFAQPLAIGGRLFVNSCIDGNAGPGHIEGYRVE